MRHFCLDKRLRAAVRYSQNASGQRPGYSLFFAERSNAMHQKTAVMTLDRDVSLAPVDPRLFGSFLEHLGRADFTAAFTAPAHPCADEQGFRKDVLALVRELRVPLGPVSGREFRVHLPLGRQHRPRGTAPKASGARVAQHRGKPHRARRIRRTGPKKPAAKS